MNIRSKLNIIIAASFLAAASIVIITYLSITSITHALKIENNISILQKEVSRLLILSQEYVIQPNERILVQWHMMCKNINDNVNLLQAHDIDESEFLKTLKKNMLTFEDLFSKLIEISNATDTTATSATSAKHLLNNEDKVKNALIGQLHVVSQTILDYSYKIEEKRHLELSQAQENANLTSAFFIILLSIIIIFTTLLIKRNIIRPIEALQNKMHLSHYGDFSTALKIESNDEIGMLAKEFNSMMTNLKSTTISRNNLEQHVKQRTEELYKAKKEAEGANNAKTEFLSSMSHELRTPMNAILGFAQLLELDDVDNPLSSDQKQSVNEVLKAGYHLLELITQILNLTKIESGQIDVSIKPTNIYMLLNECISLSQSAFKDHPDIKIINNITDQNINLDADPLYLRQIIINLLSNAIKYNNKHGTVIIDSHISDNGMLRICFIDTGNGISENKLHLLFQPFERLNFKNGNIEGSGIGLHVSKILIEQMCGKIGVESTVGTGSTFWIELHISKTQ